VGLFPWDCQNKKIGGTLFVYGKQGAFSSMTYLCSVQVLDATTNDALVMWEVVCSDCVCVCLCLHAVTEVTEWFSVESQAPTSMNYLVLSSLLPQHGV
jgi:hypothetical protein